MLNLKPEDVQGEKISVILDYKNLVNRNLFVNVDPLDEKFKYWKQKMLTSLNYICRTFQPVEFIMAMDRSSWRKEFYPEYKANRAARYAPGGCVIDWQKFCPVENEFITKMKELFPNFKWIEVDRAEADDVCGVLCRDFKKDVNDGKFVVVTSDRDMHQLLRYKNVRIYNPIKQAFVECPDPYKYLQIKIVCGDKGDNIPGIKDKMGEKTAIKFLESGELLKMSPDSEPRKNYERNKKLIDLDCVPTEISEQIKEAYKKSSESEFQRRKYTDYIMSNVQPLFAKIDDHIRNFSRIKNINN